jgi:DNA-3-methyladenine glycosylase
MTSAGHRQNQSSPAEGTDGRAENEVGGQAGAPAASARARHAVPLAREFFDRSSAEVAPDLLGCLLVHDSPAGLVAAVLTETEAYDGEADPASHAFHGRTERNAVMYGPPGHAYVYFTYGMHFCVNLVCRPPGAASAVLLRAGRVTDGTVLAAARRAGHGRTGGAQGGRTAGAHCLQARAEGRTSAGGPAAGDARPEAGQLAPAMARDLARGPARLCQALGIDRASDGADACDPASPLLICPPPEPVAARAISSGPRVGISRAAEVPWRFWVAGDPFVSAYRAYQPRRRDS